MHVCLEPSTDRFEGITVIWQGKVSRLVGAALGQFQYGWLVKKRVIVAQTMWSWTCRCCQGKWAFHVLLLAFDLFGGHCIHFSASWGRSQGSSLPGWKGVQGHLLQQDQLSWRGIYQALLLKHSQDSGGFHTWCVISAGQAFGTCRLQQMILIVPVSSSQRVFPIQSVF